VYGGVVRLLLNLFVAAVLTTCAPGSAVAGVDPSATIAGTVTLTAADGSTWAGDGVRLALACEADGTIRTEVADDRGAFRFLNVPIDRCSIEADVQGFFAQAVTIVTAAGEVAAIELHLDVAPLGIGVNVGGTTPAPERKMLPGTCRSDARRQVERSMKRCTVTSSR